MELLFLKLQPLQIADCKTTKNLSHQKSKLYYSYYLTLHLKFPFVMILAHRNKNLLASLLGKKILKALCEDAVSPFSFQFTSILHSLLFQMTIVAEESR
jgi:hypothetical protein